jgi:phosphatidylserine decarboxylase
VYGAWSWFFRVRLDEVGAPLHEYEHLTAFFTRRLRDGAREVDARGGVMVSPVDGTVVSVSTDLAANGVLDQVKGIEYHVTDFLGIPTPQVKAGNALFSCVLYLSPGDYHRFHSPTEWTATSRTHFAGQLLPVNPLVARMLPSLFCANERVAVFGEWAHGFYSYTAVGATNVGSIRLAFDDTVRTNTFKHDWQCGFSTWEAVGYKPKHLVDRREYEQPISLRRGDDVGLFELGSTVVLIFEAPSDFRFNLTAGQKVCMGQPIGAVGGVPDSPFARLHRGRAGSGFKGAAAAPAAPSIAEIKAAMAAAAKAAQMAQAAGVGHIAVPREAGEACGSCSCACHCGPKQAGGAGAMPAIPGSPNGAAGATAHRVPAARTRAAAAAWRRREAATEARRPRSSSACAAIGGDGLFDVSSLEAVEAEMLQALAADVEAAFSSEVRAARRAAARAGSASLSDSGDESCGSSVTTQSAGYGGAAAATSGGSGGSCDAMSPDALAMAVAAAKAALASAASPTKAVPTAHTVHDEHEGEEDFDVSDFASCADEEGADYAGVNEEEGGSSSGGSSEDEAPVRGRVIDLDDEALPPTPLGSPTRGPAPQRRSP